MSTPRLWTTVHVPIPNGFDNFHPEEITHADYDDASKHISDLRTAALQEWLNRSRSLPVDISFTQWDSFPFDVHVPQSHHSYPIVNTILSVAHRWRNISIAAPAQTMICFLTHPPDGLPFLESLDFNFSLVMCWDPLSEIPQPDYSIYRTPSLRKLSLMQPLGDCLQLPVSWARLTDLTIEKQWGYASALSLPQAVECLSRCPRLVRCKLEIRFAGAVTMYPVQFPLLTLPHLESLTILEVTDVTSMFNCLDLPVLREVEYHTVLTERPSLFTLLRKSNGLIQRFTTDPQLRSIP
ncbi:hypothetical protein K443DRAFT_680973 [Laccaria amethystina LaAM-08-1]|uniref:F-box domain-containing protein n=1 Tax=Laccaria amethystina LaAM-08-1 TaxID=1095629 RepID=A0A0C9WZ99_9AGAR|nr:hypothetical protein K443DRAFT_680973 [Laccaria amethystina LaAM-08-1]